MSMTSATLNAGKRCQCSACGEFFSTDSNFDRHRRGAHGVDRRCIFPGLTGMVIRSQGSSTVWSMPGKPEVQP
jgi:hypothetical protein